MVASPQTPLEQAVAFIREFENSSIYAGIGKIDSWGENDSPPVSGETDEKDISDIAFFKKVKNVSLVVRRIDWVNGKVFDTQKEEGKDFYCLTSENKIYLCIGNNGGKTSEIEPTAEILEPSIQADGYEWQYLGTLDPSDAYHFLTTDYMPVGHYHRILYSDVPVAETLLCHTVMASQNVEGTEGGFVEGNNFYRKFILLKNPTDAADRPVNGNRHEGYTVIHLKDANLGFESPEKISSTSWSATVHTIRNVDSINVISVNGDIGIGERFKSDNTLLETSDSIVFKPLIRKGEVIHRMYTEPRRKQETDTFNLRFLFKF